MKIRTLRIEEINYTQTTNQYKIITDFTNERETSHHNWNVSILDDKTEQKFTQSNITI